MNKVKAIRCGRCGKRLRKGGDNYRFNCEIASDFDGHIQINPDKIEFENIIDDVVTSGKSSEELEEDVYFERKHKLCHPCRDEIVILIKELSNYEQR